MGVVTIVAICFTAVAWSAASQATSRPRVPDNPAVPTPPAQPIPFNHKKHLALDLQCQLCHPNANPGAMMTFPATSTCMSCHEVVAAEKPAIVKLTEYAKSQRPVPWVRVYALLPGIQWSHRKHLDAGAKCETCHGAVSEMETMAMVTGVTAMGACINCHQMNDAKTSCSTCHLWP